MKFNLGILTNFLNFNKSAEMPAPQMINGQPVKTVEVGVAGTQIYGGYFNEDYLGQLHGRQWMDTIDKMRRSDAQVQMLLKCIKLPIKSADWKVQKLEESPEADLQQKLYENVMFRDTGKSFKKTLSEILTCIDFGNSLMETTFGVKFDDPDLGTYNTLKSLSWRSQRTIERWVVDRNGALQYVLQIAYGDEGRMVEIDSRFLLHFCPDQEGDNYEGIAACRYIYGNWLRKNHNLRLMASGIEKSAIPTPVLKVPAGKENSDEYRAAKKMLQAYTSNQSNYLTFPAGWELDVKQLVFDVEKMKSAIDFENQEMMNSALASFLIMGQHKGSSGNRALSNDLSDFFKMSQQYIADHITEQLDEKLFQKILDMNFGPNTKRLVSLTCDGLAEQADVAWSEILMNLTKSGVVKPDRELEESVRDDFGLTPVDEATQKDYAPPVTTEPKPAGNPQMAETWQKVRLSKETLRRGFARSLKS